MTPIAITKKLIMSAAAALVLAGPATAGPFYGLPTPNYFGGGFSIDPLLFLPRHPDLSIANVSTTRSGSWVYLRVTVRNVGFADWRSGSNQQSVITIAGTESRTLTGGLTYVPAGGSRVLAGWVRNQWYPGNEFAPNLRILLRFAPDIYTDGNLSNDDRRLYNNSLTISAAQMHSRLY